MSEWTRTVTVDGPGRTQALAERLGAQLRASRLSRAAGARPPSADRFP